MPDMSAAAMPLPPRAIYTSEPIYRVTVDQYHEMINSGTLTSEDPVELLEGAMVFKMPKNPPHIYSSKCVERLIESVIGAQMHYRSQDPVTFDDGEPELDGAVVKGSIGDFSSKHPGPGDIVLLIEVSNTTLERDRGIKLRSYARAGISCYWIIDLVDRQVEVYTRPDSSQYVPKYLEQTILKPEQNIPLTIGGNIIVYIPVAEILPPV
jgi:Uma2 family endonuclease